MRGDSYVPPSPAIPSCDSQLFCRHLLFVGNQPFRAGCVHGRVAGCCLGRAGRGDYERGHRGHPGGDGSPLPHGHGFGGAIYGGPAAPGAVFDAGGGGRDVAADFAADSGGGGSDDAVDVQVEGGGPMETITVSETPRILDENPSSVSALLEERAIKDLPLNGRRYTDLLLLVPGVTQDPRGLTSGSNGDLSYGGIRGYNTSFLVDGGDNNNGFCAQAMGRYRAPYQFSDEVVQEFRVQSSGYVAESGRAGGAVVNILTKSGTNTWHGSAFYYLRDNSLGGAAPAFVGSNPSEQQNQFGATIGGPIQRDKTFFLASYDQLIFHVPAVVQFENGSTFVTPQLGTYPSILDYEVCDPHIGGTACDQAI